MVEARGAASAGCALSFLGVALLVSACGGGAPPAPPAPPPATVDVATLEPKPMDDASEYIATLRSLRSTEVRPQVDGIITRIDVKSGDRVKAGTRLLRIDAQRQQAAVSTQDANHAARDAELALARTELERTRALLAGGAISQQEFDRAEATVKRLEAESAAASAQLRESRVELQYFDVVAPAAGIVGDVPVRVGNRVSPADVLTTIEQNTALEVYVYVPTTRAAALAPGLPIEILGPGGDVAARTKVSFIGPTVDAVTQSVLVKGTLPGAPGLRSMQNVRARIIWRREDRLVVPVVAVQRINGQHFVFVAEAAPKGSPGALVARQKPVELGPIEGDAYTVLGGLTPGQRVVVSGTQRLIDGAPIAAGP